MVLYYCQLTLHDNVFFATREMGILYETEQYLHNWALSYAFFGDTYIPLSYANLGQYIQKPGYLDPKFEQNLLYLNPQRIYVFPGFPQRYFYQINTFKAAQVNYYGKSKQFGGKGASRNYPINYGRAKELGVGSEYSTYIYSKKEIDLPRWIRLGKWMAKVKVNSHQIPDSAIALRSGTYACHHPLNPLDLPESQEILLYNRIVMPPVSLIAQAQLSGEYCELKGDDWDSFRRDFPELKAEVCLPIGVAYGAREIANVS
jgi:CRISPR-associated protein Csc1